MHRVTGANYSNYTDPTDSEAKRINVDQNLPTVPGTSDIAADRNCIQEEICHVIEYAGLDVIGDSDVNNAASLDFASGFVQLRDAIFDSEAIVTGAIKENNLLLDRLAFPANRVSGVEEITFDCGSLIFSRSDVTDQSILNYDGLLVYNSSAQTLYSSKGIKYLTGPGDASIKGASLRKASYVLTGMSWAEIDSAGAAYTSTVNFVTDLPKAVMTSGFGIVGAWIKWGVETNSYYIQPATLRFVEGTTYIEVVNLTVQCFSDAYPPPSAFNLIVEYDANGL